LQSQREGGKAFQILETETWEAREPKSRLWCDTDSNEVAEERIDLLQEGGKVRWITDMYNSLLLCVLKWQI